MLLMLTKEVGFRGEFCQLLLMLLADIVHIKSASSTAATAAATAASECLLQ